MPHYFKLLICSTVSLSLENDFIMTKAKHQTEGINKHNKLAVSLLAARFAF
jgi:hypothetical protein